MPKPSGTNSPRLPRRGPGYRMPPHGRASGANQARTAAAGRLNLCAPHEGLPHRMMGGYGGGDHPFPFRTGQLSPPAPMVLRKRESRSPPAPTGGLAVTGTVRQAPSFF